MCYKVYCMNLIEDCTSINKKIDAFICFNTQEDRASNVLIKLNHCCNLTEALVLSFENEATFEINWKQDIKLNLIKVEKDLSASILPSLIKINEHITNKTNIAIDISCMPIPIIAQLLHFLFGRYNGKNVTIYYTEPSHYTLKNLFDYSAYNGEIDIKTIPGFEGKTSNISEIKRVLFYLMGFEMTYLNKLIPQDVNPNKIAPINGFPSYYPKYKDISLINNNANFYERDVEIIYSEANNPFETYNTLYTLANNYKDYQIDIIPVGTKPMALGACLYAIKNVNNSCRIIFPFPSEYTPNQSTGCGKLWEYQL